MENKTAVQWLIDHIKNPDGFPYNTPEELFKMALQMEKEQMEDAVSNGISKADMTNNRGYFDFDKYYNETYKSEDNG